jgi:hypothetical protein
MNDAIYEHIVARKSSPLDLIKKILVILLLVIISVFAFAALGPFALLAILILGFLANVFIFSRINKEYEYTLLNHDMDVDVIYSRQKRKRILSFDFQKAEIIAPRNSPRLKSYNIEKTYDFSSADPDEKAFSIIIPINQKRTCVIIEPDQGMINHMRPWMGSKFHLD